MSSEQNVKVVGRDRDGVPQQALVDNNGGLNVNNINIGDTFNMNFFANTTGSFLMLTSDNANVATNAIGYNATGLIPAWGVARPIWIQTNTAGLIAQIKVYGIDLNNDEIIFYVITNGTNQVTTGNTKPDGSGATVNMTTGLRHVNRMEHNFVSSSGLFFARCIINSVQVTLCIMSHYYIDAPIYVCPNGRRTIGKGFVYIATNAQNSYEFIVWKKPLYPSINGTFTPSFPYRITIISTATNNNGYQWSDTGLFTVNEGEWVVFNRESSTTQSQLSLQFQMTEYKY